MTQHRNEKIVFQISFKGQWTFCVEKLPIHKLKPNLDLTENSDHEPNQDLNTVRVWVLCAHCNSVAYNPGWPSCHLPNTATALQKQRKHWNKSAPALSLDLLNRQWGLLFPKQSWTSKVQLRSLLRLSIVEKGSEKKSCIFCLKLKAGLIHLLTPELC